MRHPIKLLAVTLLGTILVSATAGKAGPDPNAFSININASLTCPADLDYCYYEGKFTAKGAIVDAGILDSSGLVFSGTGYYLSLYDTASATILIKGATFEVYAYPDWTLVGTGTAVGRVSNDRVRWRLKGTLIGG